jgi:hypothetical protein
LDNVPALQQMRAIQMEFLCEMLRRRTLSDATQNQHNRFTGIATLAPDSVGEEIVDGATPPTPIIENRSAMAIMRGLVFRQRMSLGTAQALGM